jgi:hypothetical protein
MSTPARLTELECPNCRQLTWVMDPDFTGMRDGLLREQRPYRCAACGQAGPGWIVRRQSPPEFVLQPHELYPMTQDAFYAGECIDADGAIRAHVRVALETVRARCREYLG